MRIVLKQIFPLGRFHATPWRVNPFDDPHGEWPPSPWRLLPGCGGALVPVGARGVAPSRKGTARGFGQGAVHQSVRFFPPPFCTQGPSGATVFPGGLRLVYKKKGGRKGWEI